MQLKIEKLKRENCKETKLQYYNKRLARKFQIFECLQQDALKAQLKK